LGDDTPTVFWFLWLIEALWFVGFEYSGNEDLLRRKSRELRANRILAGPRTPDDRPRILTLPSVDFACGAKRQRLGTPAGNKAAVSVSSLTA
jgi:hypothetical protein